MESQTKREQTNIKQAEINKLSFTQKNKMYIFEDYRIKH